MSRTKSQALHRADAGAEKGYCLLPHIVLRSDAYRTASFRARAVLVAIAERFNGYNNGRICLSAIDLGEVLDCRNYRSNALALGELVARGLIAVERVWPNGSRKASEYRLTWVTSGPEGKIKQATNEYRQWREGDAGTQRKRGIGNRKQNCVATIAEDGGVSIAAIAEEGKQSVATIAEDEPRNNGNEPFSELPSSAVVAVHIGNQSGRVGSSSRNRVETPGGAESGDLAELRERIKTHLLSAGVGAQSRLAEAAQIPPGTLSKFINGRSLPNDYRMKLQLVLYRARTDRAAA